MILRLLQILFASVVCFFVLLQGVFANIELKMSDAIAPFFDEGKKIQHYSNIPFYQLDSYGEKLVDEKQLAESKTRFIVYTQKLKEAGYNALSLDDINHLLLFEKSGYYPKDSDIFKRNTLYRVYYKELIEIATSQGLKVFFNTDMQFYTTPLEQRVGKIDEKNTKLKALNTEAFTEIFETFPEISGVILRVGEGGSSYNAGDYKSAIVYKTSEEVNQLLQDLLPIFEQHQKQLVFRTWTIGIGKIGDLVHNTETYDKVFQNIDSKNILISIKHTPGDFFWFSELNPTIGHGSLPQMVEIQIRREYEGGGDFPNYMGNYYQQIYNEIQQKNTVVGVYNWNQTGGWGWGHNILFNFGFTFWNEVNFYAVGNVLKTGSPKLAEVLSRFDLTKEEQQVVKNILVNSREAIKKGWYIDEFREQDFKISGIRLPPLLWIWWDKTTSSPLVLSLVSNLVSDETTIEESAFSLGMIKQEQDAFQSIASDSQLAKDITFTLQHRYKIFEINHLFKKDAFAYFLEAKISKNPKLEAKIREYQQFAKGKSFVHYDFSEIQKFYDSHRFSHFFAFIHIFLGILYLLFYIYFSHIKAWYDNNKQLRIVFFLLFVVIISGLLITPLFFLSAFNIYYILLYMNAVLIVLISLYFFIFAVILKKIYKLELKVQSNFLRILYLVFPVVIVLELVVLLSLVFGEQFFWRYITYPYVREGTRLLFAALFFVYFAVFVYYASKFANIFPIEKGRKHIKKLYLGIYILLPVYLLFLFSVDEQIFIQEWILKNMLPSYFFDAGSGVGEFF